MHACRSTWTPGQRRRRPAFGFRCWTDPPQPLPAAGVAENIQAFAVGRSEGAMVGSSGVTYASCGLLRSVAVDASKRNCGVGASLVDHAVARAREQDLVALYLLTTSARAYFERYGLAVCPPPRSTSRRSRVLGVSLDALTLRCSCGARSDEVATYDAAVVACGQRRTTGFRDRQLVETGSGTEQSGPPLRRQARRDRRSVANSLSLGSNMSKGTDTHRTARPKEPSSVPGLESFIAKAGPLP
jgi:GNAT superfamily N-acetyltransferase